MPGRAISILIATLLFSAACDVEGESGLAPSENDERTIASTVVTATFSLVPLDDFVPVRDATFRGGECTPFTHPHDGSRRLTVHFPSKAEAEAYVTVGLDDTNDVVQYSESRGVLPPGTTLDAPEARAHAFRRTHIQLDYATGEALATNWTGGDGPNQIARGTVGDFERTEVFGDLVVRADRVRWMCGV
jgi:hypothetical protein